MLKFTKTRYIEEFFYHDTDEMIGQSLEHYGEYSQREIDFILSFLNSQSIVYDVGANIGYHTTAFASVAKKVYAFEPHPKNYALLQKNTEALDNVYIGQYAVSNSRHTCWVNDYDENSISNFGMVSVNTDAIGIEVEAIDLDTAGLDLPDFIKIDVEGYELNVLQGAKWIVEAHTPVVYYEAHESKHLREIYELLSADRYRFYWAQVNNYNATNYKNNQTNIFGETGLMAILAWPKKLGTLSMLELTGPDDSVAKFYVGGKP